MRDLLHCEKDFLPVFLYTTLSFQMETIITYCSTQFGPQSAADHEVDASTLHRPVGGHGADRANGQAEDEVGQHELQDGLGHSGVAHDVTHSQEEQGAEHGQGDGGEDAFEGAQSPRLALVGVFRAARGRFDVVQAGAGDHAPTPGPGGVDQGVAVVIHGGRRTLISIDRELKWDGKRMWRVWRADLDIFIGVYYC